MSGKIGAGLLFVGILGGVAGLTGCGNYIPSDYRQTGAIAIERSEDGSILLHVDSCGSPMDYVNLSPYSQKPARFKTEREDPISEPFTLKFSDAAAGWDVTTYLAPDGTEEGWIASAGGPDHVGVRSAHVSIELFNKLKPGQYYIGWEDGDSELGDDYQIVTKETFHNAVCEKEE